MPACVLPLRGGDHAGACLLAARRLLSLSLSLYLSLSLSLSLKGYAFCKCIGLAVIVG